MAALQRIGSRFRFLGSMKAGQGRSENRASSATAARCRQRCGFLPQQPDLRDAFEPILVVAREDFARALAGPAQHYLRREHPKAQHSNCDGLNRAGGSNENKVATAPPALELPDRPHLSRDQLAGVDPFGSPSALVDPTAAIVLTLLSPLWARALLISGSRSNMLQKKF